jgi:hypothetical protein
VNRRSFVFFSAGLPPALAAPFSQSDEIKSPIISFDLGLGPGKFVQHAACHQDLLYFVIHDDGNNISFAICATKEGGIVWRRTLSPGNNYTGLGIRTSGNLVLPSFRRGLVGFQPASDSGVILNLDTVVPNTSVKRFDGILPKVRSPRLLPLGSSTVLIMDRTTGRYVRLDTATGTRVVGRR